MGRRAFLGAAATGAASAGLIGTVLQPVAAHAAGSATDDSGSSDFRLVWEEQFEGGRLDPEVWEYELGNIRGNSAQHYSSSSDNVRVENGQLVITATDRPAQDRFQPWPGARQVRYNSASVRTHGRRDFLYGKIEVRGRLPRGKGAFPAFWTLGHDFPLDNRINPAQGHTWPSCGEIDIMEIIGAPTARRAAEGEQPSYGQSNRVLWGTPHFYYAKGNEEGNGTYLPYRYGTTTEIAEDFAEAYHVFGINRSPGKIEWTLDGRVYWSVGYSDDPADQPRRDAAQAGLNRPHYLQINLALGGDWAGDVSDHLAEDGTRLEVDWVRFSQTPQQAAQDAAYRSRMPVLQNVRDIAIRQGEAADLIAAVTVDRPGYDVQLSVNDTPMFVNTGAPGGRNEVHLRVRDENDAAAIAALPEGVYSLYYTAIPKGATITGARVPTAPTARARAFLTVLPAAGLSGQHGAAVSSVALPAGHRFRDGSQMLADGSSYLVDFVNPHDPIPEAKRLVHTYRLSSSAISIATKSPFADIKEGHEHFEAVLWAYSAGITKGYPDGTYRPLSPVNRDAMAAFLHRMAGSPAVSLPSTEPFTDIKRGDQHYEAVIWAYQNGITTGYPDGSYRPTQPIARNAMAAFLYRYAGSPAVSASGAPFVDVPAGSAFAREIAWLKQRGITKGWPDGTYRPYGPMNRDATAAFIQRAVVEAGVTFGRG